MHLIQSYREITRGEKNDPKKKNSKGHHTIQLSTCIGSKTHF